MKAWHFVGSKLRDGRAVPKDGEKLKQSGEIIPCENGLHGSVRILDALQYAPPKTKWICRTEHCGVIVEHGDKVASSERTIIWRVEADPILRKVARMCASDVLHLWDAPEIVKEYLKTGDEKIRAAAARAARAAGDAAGAAGDAAWAAWDAARAAKDAAWAARDAAWAAGAAGDAKNKRLTRLIDAAHKEAK
jgi:hypothetical protein